MHAEPLGLCGAQIGNLCFTVSSGVEKAIPVAARSMVWVCGRSLAGIEDSNPAESMDVCLL